MAVPQGRPLPMGDSSTMNSSNRGGGPKSVKSTTSVSIMGDDIPSNKSPMK